MKYRIEVINILDNTCLKSITTEHKDEADFLKSDLEKVIDKSVYKVEIQEIK